MSHVSRATKCTVHFIAATVSLLFFVSEASARDADPVWRVEIEFTTADVSDASTDDRVEVRLNGNNLTKLDYARDDFERDTTLNYDLNLEGISTIADIERIEISKKGSDGWCIEAFVFRINNVDVYQQSFDDPLLCLDNSGTKERRFEVSGTTLRDDDLWRDYSHPRPRDIVARGIPNDETISRVEGLFGHAIVGIDELYWGKFHGAPVELERVNDNRIHIDLDMAYKRVIVSDDSYDVDVDFVISCANGRISTAYENIETDLDWKWYKIFPLPNTYLFASAAEIEIMPENLHTFRNGCPVITIENNGDVIFTNPVQRVSGEPGIETDVDDCTYSSTLESFVVTTKGAGKENGEREPGAISHIGLDGVLKVSSVDVSKYNRSGETVVSRIKSFGDELYLAEQRVFRDSGRASSAVSIWNPITGEKISETAISDVARIRDFAIAPNGEIFIIEDDHRGRVFRVTESRVLEYAQSATKHLGEISSISVTEDGQVILTGYDSNVAVIYDKNGEAVARQPMADKGVARAVFHSTENTFVSDGQTGSITKVDANGVSEKIYLDSPHVDKFCLSQGADFALVPFVVEGGFGIYPLGSPTAK